MMMIHTLCAFFLLVTASASAFLSPSLLSCCRPTTTTLLGSHEKDIARLLQEYRDLQDNLGVGEEELRLLKESIDLQEQLRGDLQDHRNFDASYDAEALLQKEVEINALEVKDMREKAQMAQKQCMDAMKDAQKAQSLQKQAQEETQWALDEVVFLESMGPQNEELEALLLAQAAHDLKETNDLVEQTQEGKTAALQQEVHVKDLLWYLVQREENLKRLQENHTQKELKEWAEREKPRLESIAQVLRRKLVAHDPNKGTVAF
jgi:hypothetical protein